MKSYNFYNNLNLYQLQDGKVAFEKKNKQKNIEVVSRPQFNKRKVDKKRFFIIFCWYWFCKR